MMRLLTYLLLLSSLALCAQRDWSGPTGNEPLPEKIALLQREIEVNHFPKINDPIKIKDTYYWKHLTAILCKTQAVTITEYGAYLFYDGQWNLRAIYPLKDLDKTFKTKNQRLLQGQPYTWAKNWRVDKNLYGGWALWYFIGITPNGQKICGYQTIHTTTNLLNK